MKGQGSKATPNPSKAIRDVLPTNGHTQQCTTPSIPSMLIPPIVAG